VGRARISEEVDPRNPDAEARNRSDFGAGETVEGNAAMKNDPLKLIRGSGNVYLDLGQDGADVKQLKALLAAEIIKTLDRDKLTVRAAHARTGIAAADFSRIRNADLARFTVDRLVGIINRLGSRVEIKLKVKPAARSGHAALA
jgi:predicted XRE-type DNA-binding protein